MKGVFITGTDTDIGKTLISAWLVKNWSAEYWKPVQSGGLDRTDSDCVRSLVPWSIIHPSVYTLDLPLSPHEAAARQGVEIRMESFVLPAAKEFLVVEGAGGVLVPLNDRQVMADLMKHLNLPAILVAKSGLGTINHTLLSLEAMRKREIAVLGVIMNGPINRENKGAIEHFGETTVLAEIPRLFDLEQIMNISAPKRPE